MFRPFLHRQGLQLSPCKRRFSAKSDAISLSSSKLIQELCQSYAKEDSIADPDPAVTEKARMFIRTARLLENYIVLKNQQDTKNMLFQFRSIDPDRSNRHYGANHEDNADHFDLQYLKERLFLDQFAFILKLGGYQEVTQKTIENRLTYHRKYGNFELEVHLDHYEFVRFWVRGRKEMDKELKESKWIWEPWKEGLHDGVLHERVIVASRSHKSNNMILKGFKDIPVHHFEALLPEARIRIPWRHRWLLNLLIVLPGVLCFFDIYLPFVTDHKLDIVLILAIFCGAISYRTAVVYNSRVKQSILSWKRMLYYKSTANNAGLVLDALNRTRERVWQEALIVYATALRLTDSSVIVTEPKVTKAACEWLSSFSGREVEEDDVNFDSSFSFLRRLGLIKPEVFSSTRESKYAVVQVLEPQEAIEMLLSTINEVASR